MMLALFGFMDLLIIVKWCTNYFGQTDQAPSIITMMVGLFLNAGKVTDGLELFSGQQYVNNLMTIIALSCVPWMLVVKPFLEYKEYKVKLLQRKLRGDVELEDVNPYQEVQRSAFDDEHDASTNDRAQQ